MKYRIFFITHAHSDHVGLLKYLLDSNSKIKFICSKESKEVLLRGENSNRCGFTNKILNRVFKILSIKQDKFPPLEENDFERCIMVEDNIEKVEKILGGKIIFSSGHTDDSISLLLDDNQMFCGDMAMNFFIAKNMISLVAENVKDYIKSWNKIIELKPKIIYPGHGKAFSYLELKKNLQHLEKMKIYF